MEQRENHDRGERRVQWPPMSKQRDPFRDQGESYRTSADRDCAMGATEYRQRQQPGIGEKDEAKEKERMTRERRLGRNPK